MKPSGVWDVGMPELMTTFLFLNNFIFPSPVTKGKCERFRLPRLCYNVSTIAITNISAKSTYKSTENSLLISTVYPMFLSFYLTVADIPLFKSKPVTDSSKSFCDGISDILAQADTDQPVARHVRTVPISVESHAFETRMGGCRTEVRRFCITTPTVTLLVTVGVTRNEEA